MCNVEPGAYRLYLITPLIILILESFHVLRTCLIWKPELVVTSTRTSGRTIWRTSGKSWTGRMWPRDLRVLDCNRLRTVEYCLWPWRVRSWELKMSVETYKSAFKVANSLLLPQLASKTQLYNGNIVKLLVPVNDASLSYNKNHLHMIFLHRRCN